MEEKFSWHLNVRDKYKELSQEEIKQALRSTALPGAVLMSQIQGDFNFGSVIRAANFFNLSNIYYYGPRKKYDRRGCVGTYVYSKVEYLPTIEDVANLRSRYTMVGLENNLAGRVPVSLYHHQWKQNSLIVIGEEGPGIPTEILELCKTLVEIPNRGSVRSLNAATAGGIAMSEYVRQMQL